MSITTQKQVSAGGVVFRRWRGQVQVALISVGENNRWQLPKGLVGRDEAPEAAAQREVGEEAGLETELLGEIEKIEYWYFGKSRGGKRLRFHKHVYFYLFRATGGDVSQHDHEVNEARWVAIDDAIGILTFANEKQVVEKARELIPQAEG
jgi:8-oxo-dGTP pyrophosphatase MutT (NUDIX family)